MATDTTSVNFQELDRRLRRLVYWYAIGDTIVKLDSFYREFKPMGRKGFRVVYSYIDASVSYEVFVRYVNSPTVWAFDMMVQMYGALFLMAGAYTLAQDAPARRRRYRFSSAVASSYRLFLYILFFFPGMMALFWYGWEIASDGWRYKEVSWNSPARIQFIF